MKAPKPNIIVQMAVARFRSVGPNQRLAMMPIAFRRIAMDI